MDNLKIAKSLKLSFDKLGYAFVSGGITTDRGVYRGYLRSGKQNPVKRTTDNRNYQVNTFYKYFFSCDVNPVSRCDYKSVISFYLGLYKGTNTKVFKGFNKHITQVANKLVKSGYIQVYDLPESTIVKDTINDHTFYYSKVNKKVYRLINNKHVNYRLK